MFKTREKYGFDSIIFSNEVIDIMIGYISCIRPRLNPICDYLLISRNGTQLKSISDIFGRIVYQAIGKYINPTRYRQIIETESASKLDVHQQHLLSEDQKHTSNVARVHYKKQQSRDVARKSKECMEKLINNRVCNETLSGISRNISMQISNETESDKSNHNDDSERSVNSQRDTACDFDMSAITSTSSAITSSVGRQKKIPFSKTEDKSLLEGIRKYGGGKWTSILNDPIYSFHPSRKAATLLTRAKGKKLI